MKAAIFDMDGTILDSNKAWAEFVPNSLKKHNVDGADNALYEIRYMTLEQALKHISQNYISDVSEEELLEEWNCAIHNYFSNEVQLRPGIKQYLEHLRKNNIKLCVATMTDEKYVEAAFKRLGIFELFDFIVCNAEKRDPQIFLDCAQRLGVSPCECTVYEDSAYAAKTAKQAGFNTIGIYCPFSFKPELEKYSDMLIDSFEALL